MARYSIISVARSDGRSHYLSNGHPVPNEPPRQDGTPAADGSIDYYQRLEDDDPTSVDWRRKLGGMLMEVIGGPENAGKNYMLGELPKDYVLWQHRRTRAKDGKAVAETSRQDTYLYGHPHGKGRFRSAQEFFPHLLWLVADREGDALQNCSCKFCHPEGKMMAFVDFAAKPAPVATKTKPVDVRAEAPKMAPAAAPSQPANTSKAGPSQAVNKKTAEQMLDSNPSNDFIYRPGELVWFSKGVAWGLSVVLKRNVLDGKRQYLLQPLSHPLAQSPAVVRDRDAIRPWLAWSVPGTTIAQIANLTYDQIPWERVLRGEFGNGDPKVDGSILAAKAVNESYSFFDRVDLPTPAGEVHYKGMFLGGEKIWVGEPVRLMGDTKDEIVIMVVHQMIEKTTDGKSAVTIVGDIYKFVKMPTPAAYADRQNWPANDDLPTRVNTDLRFRNEVAANAGKNVWCEWRLLEPMARQTLTDIKGRWYETKLLLPTLRGADVFESDVRSGEVSDVGLFMNARGDILNHGPGVRKKNRLATLGRAVPADVRISRGLDGPPEDNVFPEQV